MTLDAIAVWAAGRIGVGPGVKRRFLRNIEISFQIRMSPSLLGSLLHCCDLCSGSRIQLQHRMASHKPCLEPNSLSR
jgi:hypothetical protein